MRTRFSRRWKAAVAAAAVVASVFVAMPAAGSASLVVTPSTGLTHLEEIQISAAGGGAVFEAVGQCITGAPYSTPISALSWCRPLSELALPLPPVLTATVSRTISTPDGVKDCALVACEIVYGGAPSVLDTFTFRESVPIDFESGPILTVTPAFALLDESEATVTLTGVGPGATATAVECVDDGSSTPPGAPGACVDLGPLSADTLSLSGTFTVARWLTAGDGSTVDCAVATCLIGARLVEDGTTSYLFEINDFDAEPRSSVTPPSQLVDGQVVDVEVWNLIPDVAGRTVQLCHFALGQTTLPDDCRSTDAVVDSDGSRYTSSVTMQRYIPTSDGSIDCAAPMLDGSRCRLALVAPNPGGDPAFVLLEIIFASYRVVPPLDVVPSRDLDRETEVSVSIAPASPGVAIYGVCPTVIPIVTPDDARTRCDVVEVSSHPADWETTFLVRRDYLLVFETDVCLIGCEFVYMQQGDPAQPALLKETAALSFERPSVSWGLSSFGPTLVAIDDTPTVINASAMPVRTDAIAVILQCGYPVGSLDLTCSGFDMVEESNFDGSYTEAFTPQRFIPTESGTPIDCSPPADARVRCGIAFVILDADFSPIRIDASGLMVLEELPG